MNRNYAPVPAEQIDLIKTRLDRPVVLVGMMGVGKSHVGKKLAAALGVDFTDSDELIEKRAGYKIAEIFELFGEDKFRAAETRTVLEALERGPSVLSTGGGAVMNEQVREKISANSISIWLRATQEELVERLKNSRNRPLLKNGETAEVVGRLLAQRQPYYEQSKITVDIVPGSVDATLGAVINLLYAHLKTG
jgi:shikimate kinase